MPKPFLGLDCPIAPPPAKGAGTGRSDIQNSGQAACEPCVSFETSKDIVPVRPAKSNGCFGYIARTVTVPASYVPDKLSLLASRSWPLQMTMSLGEATKGVVPSHFWIWTG